MLAGACDPSDAVSRSVSAPAHARVHTQAIYTHTRLPHTTSHQHVTCVLVPCPRGFASMHPISMHFISMHSPCIPSPSLCITLYVVATSRPTCQQ